MRQREIDDRVLVDVLHFAGGPDDPAPGLAHVAAVSVRYTSSSLAASRPSFVPIFAA